MIYKKIGEFIHLLLEPLSRKQAVLEFIYTSGGSWFEKPQDRGKKHLLEHCIVARTKEYDFEAFQDFQFSQSIGVNAYTGPLTMGLNFQGHFSDAYKMLDLMTEVAFTPTFDKNILAQEKEIVLREISERSGDPAYRLHFANMSKIYLPNSYNTHQVLGDSDLVSQTTVEDFNNLLEQNIANSHLIINIAGGGFEAEEIENMVKKQLQLNSTTKNLNNSQKHSINFHPGSQFQDFKFLPIVDELAHDHSEVTVFIPCNINFENRPFIDIFEDLFLKYHGVLYNELRNKLGLIYSMYSSFEISQQMLVINFSTEIKNVEKCLDIIETTFSNFEKVFNLKRFEELKDVLTKKMDLGSDTLTNSLNFSQNSLMDFGIFEDLSSFLKRLQSTSPDDIKSVYSNLKEGLVNKKTVVVSKNKLIEKLKVS